MIEVSWTVADSSEHTVKTSVARLELDDNLSNLPESDKAIDVKQLIAILLRRRLLVLAIAAGITSIAVSLALRAQPTYQSSMQLLVSSSLYQGARQSELQDGADSEFTDANLQVDYTAQLSLMTSSRLIQRAVDLLQSEYPDLTVEDIQGEPRQEAPLFVDQIEGGTGTNKFPSQVFNITFTDDDPRKAQRVLQTLQKVYLDYNLEEQKIRLTNGLSFIDEQLPSVQRRVSQAESNLEAFRQRNNLIDPEAQGQSLLDSLVAIEQARQTNQAELRDVQARYSSLQQKVAADPQQALISSRLSQSTRYQTLLNEIQKTELALAQSQTRFQPGSPPVQRLSEQRQRQFTLLQEEVQRVLGDRANQVAEGVGLQQQGQLGQTDLSLVSEMLTAQTSAIGLLAREQSLVQTEQQLRADLSRYPRLLSEYNRLKPEVDVNRRTLEQLLQAQQALGLRIAQGGFNWQVLQEPQFGISLGSGRTMLLVGGFLIGWIFGVAAALIRDLLDDTIYTPETLQRQATLPLLGTIPKLQPSQSRELNSLFFSRLQGAASARDTMNLAPFRKALDLTYQAIQVQRSPLSCQSLAVISALPSEGKTTITIGLATSAARMNQRVLIVDTDLRCPSVQARLQLDNDRGLSQLLTNEATQLQDVIQPLQPSIDVLTAGPMLEDSVKLLSSQRMKELMELLEQSYDLVLLDTAPVLDAVDASIVASFCNGVVLVGRLNQITGSAVKQTVEQFSKLNLLGVIANQSSTTIGGYQFSTLNKVSHRRTADAQ